MTARSTTCAADWSRACTRPRTGRWCGTATISMGTASAPACTSSRPGATGARAPRASWCCEALSAAAVRWTEEPPADWDELLRSDPGASPSLHAAVAGAFAAVLPGHSRAFLLVERAGRTLGGMPVVVERRGAVRWLHALPMLLPAAPIARAGAHAEVDAAIAG